MIAGSSIRRRVSATPKLRKSPRPPLLFRPAPPPPHLPKQMKSIGRQTPAQHCPLEASSSPACHALLSSQRFTSYTRISSVVDTSAPADGIVLAGSVGRVRVQRCTVHSTTLARALYFKRSTDVASIAASTTKERVQNVTFFGKRGATASSAVVATGWRTRRVHFST